MKLPKTLDDVAVSRSCAARPRSTRCSIRCATRLLRVEAEYRGDEELFDEAFGPIGDLSLLAGDPARLVAARERLWRHEETIRKHLSNLCVELKLRGEQASLRLEREEDRAVWATLLLAVIALGVGVGRHARRHAHLAPAAHAGRARPARSRAATTSSASRLRRPTRSARSAASSTPWPRRSTSASSGSSAPSASPPSAKSPRRSRTRCAIRCRRSGSTPRCSRRRPRARRASWRAPSSRRSTGSPRSPRSTCASRACRGPSSSARTSASS